MSKRNLDHELKIRVVDNIAKVICSFFKWGTLGFSAYLIRDSLVAMAGKTTEANVLFGLVADVIDLDDWRTVVILALVIWGTLERKLRQRATAHLASKRSKAERQLEPEDDL